MMQLPRKLKKVNMYSEGVSYANETHEVTLPKLGRKFEEWRGGGMDGPVPIDMGQDGLLTLEHSYGGFIPEVFIGTFGMQTHAAAQLRFVGAHQREDNGEIASVEVVVRGRHQEIDQGKSKVGTETEHKIKSALTYYKLMIDGQELVEIDVQNGVYRVNGIDHQEALRAAAQLP